MRTPATRRNLALLAAAALVVLAATAFAIWSRADDASSWDVPLYQSFGDRMADGEVPYRDFRVEYPPGSLPAFLLPSLVAPDGGPRIRAGAERRRARVRACVRGADDGAPRCDGRPDGGRALRAPARRSATPRRRSGSSGATPLLLGELALTRFDALPVALTAATVAALVHGRPRLAARRARPRDHGEALSASPRAPRRALRGPPRGPPRGAGRRSGSPSRRWGSSSLPFVALAPGEAWFSIRAQLARGVQVESLPGSIAVALGVAADKVGLGTLGIGVAEGGTGDVRSADVTGALGQVAGARRRPGCAGDRRRSMDRGLARRSGAPGRLVRDCAAVVAAQLALGRVLSPQFVLWLVPLVPLVAGRRGRLATAPARCGARADARLVPGALPRLRQHARRARDRLSARTERAAARAARRAGSADRTCCPVAEQPDGGEEDERGGDGDGVGGLRPHRHHGREQHRERRRATGASVAHQLLGLRSATADDCGDQPQPERRIELRRTVHLKPEPRAPPAVGERGVEPRDTAVVGDPTLPASRRRRTRRGARSATSTPRGSSCPGSRSGRSGTPTGWARPRWARAASALRRRPSDPGPVPPAHRWRGLAEREPSARRSRAWRAPCRSRAAPRVRMSPGAPAPPRARPCPGSGSRSPSPTPGRRG